MAAVVILVTLLLPDIVVPFANTMPVATRSRKQKQKQKQAAAAAAVAASSAVVPTVVPAVVPAGNSQLLEVVSSNAATIGNIIAVVANQEAALQVLKAQQRADTGSLQTSLCDLQQKVEEIQRELGKK